MADRSLQTLLAICPNACAEPYIVNVRTEKSCILVVYSGTSGPDFATSRKNTRCGSVVVPRQVGVVAEFSAQLVRVKKTRTEESRTLA